MNGDIPQGLPRVDIQQLTDLQLAKLQGDVYEDLLKMQGNLLAIRAELRRREPKQPVVDANKTIPQE